MSIAWESRKKVEKGYDEEEEETQRFSLDFQINQKIKAAAADLQPFIQRYFFEFASDRDKELVADFILSCIRQENIAANTRRSYIVAVATMARYLKGRSLEAITSKDLTGYLNSMQRDEIQDPDQSWIGNQRVMGLPLLKFFKWMAYPDLTPQERKHVPRDRYPEVLKGFLLHRKKGSKTPVKTKDIWYDEDAGIFLKYCTDNPRLRFYHALAYETSARPGELLRLKIGDILVSSDSDTGKLYASLEVGRYGKKKEGRIVSGFLTSRSSLSGNAFLIV
jgi:integrase